jgi:hypothetical protein
MAISDLIRDLENATGPDRSLDLSIAFIARHRRENEFGASTGTDVPPYTSSIEAALHLARKLAPHASGGFSWQPDGTNMAVVAAGEYCHGNSPALAICIAALRSKQEIDRLQSEILKRSGTHYRALFRMQPTRSQTLLVVLSPYSGFMLAKRDFGVHTLYLYEGVNSYFTFQADLLAQDIVAWAKNLGVQEVVFTGSSKAGYGALLSGRIFSDPDGLIAPRVVAFSPVTRVYPLEKPLPFRTYPTYLKLVEEKAHVRTYAERHGALPQRPASAHYQEKIIFGEFCDYDRQEIQHLLEWTVDPARFVRLSTVPASTHNVISLLAADKTDLEAFVSYVARGERDSELPWHEHDAAALRVEAARVLEAIRGVTLEDVLGVALPAAEPDDDEMTSRSRSILKRVFHWR